MQLRERSHIMAKTMGLDSGAGFGNTTVTAALEAKLGGTMIAEVEQPDHTYKAVDMEPPSGCFFCDTCGDCFALLTT